MTPFKNGYTLKRVDGLLIIIDLELSPPIFTEEAIEVEAGKDRAQKAAGGI